MTGAASSSRCILSLLLLGGCASKSADGPVYQGSDSHDHYVTLSQITPANVAQLEVAWTYDTKDAFPGSEMQLAFRTHPTPPHPTPPPRAALTAGPRAAR